VAFTAVGGAAAVAAFAGIACIARRRYGDEAVDEPTG
jgi:hypothetical protein